tara:strand:- start:1373 stop:1525 length:153 start_codon:yes stop_codon:yes gene_type:complete
MHSLEGQIPERFGLLFTETMDHLQIGSWYEQIDKMVVKMLYDERYGEGRR